MKEVIIRKFNEGKCTLYKHTKNVPEGLLIGVVTSLFQINDIRLQCKEIKSNDYFFLWENSDGVLWKISINEEGSLSDYPIGFFDLLENQLDQLIDWEKK